MKRNDELKTLDINAIERVSGGHHHRGGFPGYWGWGGYAYPRYGGYYPSPYYYGGYYPNPYYSNGPQVTYVFE